MKTFRRLKNKFCARDQQGNEYEVSVYVDVTSGATTGSGTLETEGFASAEAVGITGPFQGLTFRASFVEGDDYQINALPIAVRITRIR